MPLKLSDMLIMIVALLGVTFAFFKPMNSTEFFASDWNRSFWGPFVWNGWNYYIPPEPRPPRPALTKFNQTF